MCCHLFCQLAPKKQPNRVAFLIVYDVSIIFSYDIHLEAGLFSVIQPVDLMSWLAGEIYTELFEGFYINFSQNYRGMHLTAP